MVKDLVGILEDITEKAPFNKSITYVENAKQRKYTKEQAMNLMLKEPTVFLSPVVFILFRSYSKVNITLQEYASIIMKQARKKNNQKLFEAAKAAYVLGKEKDL